MSDLFKWRQIIASKSGPHSPVTRHLLLTMSLHMDENGKSCFPSTRTLAEETALSERSVVSHIARAIDAGWLIQSQRGLSGQGWKRHQYQARIPLEALKEVQHVNHEGAERPSSKVLNEVQSSSSNNSPKKMFNQDSDQIRLASLLFALIQKNHPKAKAPNLQKWARHIDLSIRCDGRTLDELERVIRWCQADSFWSSNILSTDKLRAKFDQLWLKMRKNGHHDSKPFDQDTELRRCL